VTRAMNEANEIERCILNVSSLARALSTVSRTREIASPERLTDS